MELITILSKCDHTLLAQTATWSEIKAICDDGMKYHTASVSPGNSHSHGENALRGGVDGIFCIPGIPEGMGQFAIADNLNAVYPPVASDNVLDKSIKIQSRHLHKFGSRKRIIAQSGTGGK